MSTPLIPYRRNAVQPMECLRLGWELVRGQFWLFVGMTFVGFLIGSAVPMGILMGPMMCGLYLAFFKRRRGEPIEFGLLFKGFDYFGNSVVAALLHALPIVAVVVPSYIIFYLGMFVSLTALGNDPSGAGVLGVFFLFAVFFLVVMAAIMVLTIGFTFSYPLIVDRKMAGFDSVKLSFKAAMANFGRLLAIVLLCALLNLLGLLVCYVGIFLTLPITYAAVAVAYEQVFGLAGPGDVMPNLPPPPPVFE